MNVAELKKGLEERMQAIGNDYETELEQVEQSYLAIGQYMQQLKQQFMQEKSSEEAMVFFFKEVKPYFLSQMIYMAEVYRMLANQPCGNKKAIKRYYYKEQKLVTRFISDNQAFYMYFKSERTHRDKEYFSKEVSADRVPETNFIYIDEEFSTYHSTLLSMLLAYERLSNYLQNKTSRTCSETQAFSTKLSDLKWTENKVKLIELGYSIHAMGVCNNGQADIKQIMRGLEVLFNVELGNYYSVFLKNIRMRKKNVTIFLDELKNSLIRRMDDLDENPQYH